MTTLTLSSIFALLQSAAGVGVAESIVFAGIFGLVFHCAAWAAKEGR